MIIQKLAVNEAGFGVFFEQLASSAEGRKVIATHVSNNDEMNECLLLRTHDGREGTTVKMRRSFDGKL
jgi:glycerate kinase